MKKKLLFLVPMFLLVSCGESETPSWSVVSPEGSASLELTQDHLSAYVGELVDLPTPTAVDGDGKDALDDVKVEVLLSNGNVFIPQVNYASFSTFRPSLVDTYTAIYSLKVDDATSISKVATIDVTNEKDALDIVIDGVLDEDDYSNVGSYVSGVDSNLSLKLIPSDTGIYLAVDVKDNNILFSNYVTNRFTCSDGFEIFFDLSGSNDTKLNDACFKIQYSTYGRMRVFGASDNKTKYEMIERILPTYEVAYHGTPTLTGQSEYTRTYRDVDEGYTMEMFLSYRDLGCKPTGDYIGVAISHREINNIDPAKIIMNSLGNLYHNDISTPNGLYQVLLNNGVDFESRYFSDESLTCLYGKYYYKDAKKEFLAPQVESPCVIDGKNEGSEYVNGVNGTIDVNGVSSVNYSALYTNAGINVLLESNDTNHPNLKSDDIYASDAFRIAIANQDLLEKGTLINGFANKSRVIAGDLNDVTNTSYLSKDSLMYFGLFDFDIKVLKTSSGWSVEIFIPSYELGINDSDTKVGLCIGINDNNQETLTDFNSLVYSNNREDLSSYITLTKEAK